MITKSQVKVFKVYAKSAMIAKRKKL